VVNAVAPDPFPPGVPDLAERLERLPASLEIPGSPGPTTLAACARHLRGRHELNARWSAVIAETTKLPLVSLPRLAEGTRGVQALATLGARLAADPEAA
jgi:hypothetical protein